MNFTADKKIQKIRLLFRIHRYEEAEKVLCSLIKDHQGISQEYGLDALHAVSLYKQNKLDAAMNTLKAATTKYPDSVELNLCLAACLSDLGRYEEASAAFSHSKTLGFSSYRTSLEADFHRKSAELEKFLGHTQEAIAAYEQESVTACTSLKTELQIASAYFESKRFGEASKYLEKVVEKYPSSVQARTLLGLTLLSQNDSAGAEKAWTKALELHPQAMEPRVLLDALGF